MSLPPKYPLLTLMSLEAKHVAELNKILTMSVNRLDKDIIALGKAGANPITIMQAKATRASLASFLNQTFDDMEDVIRLGIREAAAAASGVVSAYEAQLLGLVMSPEAVANLAKSEAQRAAMGIEAALKRIQGSSYVPLSDTVYNTKQMVLGWVDKRITQGLASGWSAQKLANELKSMIDPNVKGGVSYAAMRTARTEINNSFHASSAERYLNSPIVMEVDWHLSSSHPEGDVCDSLAADSPYPKKSVPEKPHPQCYCFITPKLPEPAKFIDDLFKGKYGEPPAGAAAEAVRTNIPKAAGSKAAKNLAQNAVHQAIKKDPAPSKANLGNQFGWDKEFSQKNISSLKAFDELVKGMDDVTKRYVAEGGPALHKYAAKVMPEEVDVVGKYLKNQAHPKAPAISTASEKALKEFENVLTGAQIDIIKSSGVDAAKLLKILDGLDFSDYSKYSHIMKIIKNASDPEDAKWLLKMADLDPKSNSYLGDLASLAEKKLPAKVWTNASLADEFGLDIKVVNSMTQISKMTPDQIHAQLLKLSADDLADIKKIDVYDQGYYIKMGTTPTKESYLKPEAGAPDVSVPKTKYSDLEDDTGVPVDVWESTGMSPDDIEAALKHINSPGNEALLEALENGFESFDQKLIVDTVKKASANTKPPIIKPDTIPSPKPPSPAPVPKPSADLYHDVVEMYPDGKWDPKLLTKTGATPQQMVNYVEDMSQAQYDHFMNLKWPSQKKHFEKLATKTENASTYEAKIEYAKGVALDAKNIKPPLTSDPEKLAKWKGKDAPGHPLEPKAPTTPGKQAYDEFLEASKLKFKKFAESTGNPKNDLTKSNNWVHFQKVVDNNDLEALKFLKANKYIDDDLYDLALSASKKATSPDPGDAAKYKAAMEEFAKSKTKYDTDLVEWREANGVTSTSKGTWDNALVHDSNEAGTKWANSRLPTAKSDSRAAIKKYSGSSYRSWNDALRKNANGDKVPSGEWAAWTRKADQGMAPAPEDVVVRRGTGWNEFVVGGDRKTMIPPPPPNELIGSVQTQHGYTSTSVGKTSAFSGNVNMRIRIPRGHPISWVDPYSAHKGERELLISRSSNYYIHDVYQEGGRWYVDAEIVPVGEDASTWMPIKSAGRK